MTRSERLDASHVAGGRSLHAPPSTPCVNQRLRTPSLAGVLGRRTRGRKRVLAGPPRPPGRAFLRGTGRADASISRWGLFHIRAAVRARACARRATASRSREPCRTQRSCLPQGPAPPGVTTPTATSSTFGHERAGTIGDRGTGGIFWYQSNLRCKVENRDHVRPGIPAPEPSASPAGAQSSSVTSGVTSANTPATGSRGTGCRSARQFP